MKHKILDKGYVELIDHMGSDQRICDAARISTNSISDDTERNERLINYLMKNHHTSPFEQVEFCFMVKAPIFVARQWFRHRTANLNEVSGRYSILKTEFYIPEADRIKGKGTVNKQSSEGIIVNEAKKEWLKQLDIENESVKNFYDLGNFYGIANELTRINLPLSTYTEFYWKIDLHNLFNFLRLRMDDHSQFEIQEYAKAIYSIIKDIVPFASSAFEKYVLNSKTFNEDELKILTKIINIETLTELDIPEKELNELKNKLGI